MEHRRFIVIDGNHRVTLLQVSGSLADLGIKELKMNVTLLNYHSINEKGAIIDFSLRANLLGEARVQSSFADKIAHLRNLYVLWVEQKWKPFVIKSQFGK